MNEFELYLRLGIRHIADFSAFDHMLFLLAVCIPYGWKALKRLALLVTAFTLGHSLTLALSVFHIILVPSKLIEFLIPLTILITSISNIVRKESDSSKNMGWKYALVLFFGLIHGMGFSNYLRELLGHSSSIILPLFSFNVGLELGQLLIVTGILTISYILTTLFSINKRNLITIISGATAGISLILMLQNKFW